MAIEILSTIGTFFVELLITWSKLFAAPFENLEMLWIIVPIYLAWIFADFFQEKKGTSLGNAISNSIIAVWAAIDWSRTSLRLYELGTASGFHLIITIILSVIVMVYGVIVITLGIKGKSVVRKIGRIRIVTYVVLMITPLVYMSNINVGMAILAIIFFFPVFYFFLELIDCMLPDPKSIKELKVNSENKEEDSFLKESFPGPNNKTNDFKPPKF